jgi:hypothetical protein
MKSLVLVTLLSIAPLITAGAQTCSKQSPAHKVALLELYTSEGCSSCPPADEALRGLKKAAAADLVVPLALHVDYWDYIGWTDRFATPGFSQRQRRLSERGNSRTVYTPEMFIDGQELRDWPDRLQAVIGELARQAPRADIGIKLGKVSAGKLPIEVSAGSAVAAKLYVALYENGLSSNVKAGENNGVVLRHDFVVRDWIGPLTLPTDGRKAAGVVNQMLTIPVGSQLPQLGVAVFVQTDSGEVLQALALPLCGY